MNYPIVAENIFHKEIQKHIRIEDYRPTIERDCFLSTKDSKGDVGKYPNIV